MNKHQVVVTGRFDPQKVLKKLKKKTGKKVEILSKKDDDTNNESHESNKLLIMQQFRPENDQYCCIKNEDLMLFSDENPNACVLM